jgi:hypothetical protein
MPVIDYKQTAVRETEGQLDGRERNSWPQIDDPKPGEEEKVLAGQPDANIPALLTKDVPGG